MTNKAKMKNNFTKNLNLPLLFLLFGLFASKIHAETGRNNFVSTDSNAIDSNWVEFSTTESDADSTVTEDIEMSTTDSNRIRSNAIVANVDDSTENGSSEDDPNMEDVKIEMKIDRDKFIFWIENDNFILVEVNCSLNKVAEARSSSAIREFRCENLNPCTTYVVFAKYIRNSDEKDFYAKFEAETLSAVPTVEITDIRSDQFNIVFTWRTTNPTCIREFTAKAEGDGVSVSEQNINNLQTEHHFKSLKPCLEYLITLETTVKGGDKLPDQTRRIRTRNQEPGRVADLRIINNKDDSVKAVWKEPLYGSCVIYYFLKWKCEMKDCEWKNATITNPRVTEYQIENVEACTEYDLTIGTNGLQQIVEHKFNKGFVEPSPIEHFKLLSATYLNTTFSWNQPRNHRCIDHYEFRVVGPYLQNYNVNKSVILYEPRYQIDVELEPCANYSYTLNVILKTSEVNGEIKSDFFSIQEENPGPIQDIKAKYIYPKELVIVFMGPTKASICIHQYRVTYYVKDAEQSPNTVWLGKGNKTLAITGLSSCVEYVIQVNAVTHTARDGELVSLPIITPSSEASKPKFIGTGSARYNSLELSGSNEDQSNNCEILFAKFECKAKRPAAINYAEKIVQGDVGVAKFTAVMFPLSPFTDYDCSINLYNVVGWSSAKDTRTWHTTSYFPGTPAYVEAEALSNSSFTIKWLPPKYENGDLRGYKIYIQSIGPAYPMPDSCIKKEFKKSYSENPAKTEFLYIEGLAFNVYSVQVSVMNDFAIGKFSAPTYIITHPSPSDPVQEFSIVRVDGPEISDTEYRANVSIKWLPPCQSNGIIKSYLLTVYGTRPQSMPITFAKIIDKPFVNESGYYASVMLPNPEYMYQFVLNIVNHNVSEKSDGKYVELVAPAGIPEKIPSAENLTTVDSFQSKNPTNSALVKFSSKIFQSNMGQVVYAAVLISQMDCQKDPQLQVAKFDIEKGWPEVKSYKDVENEECHSQYQTTPKKWTPFVLRHDVSHERRQLHRFAKYIEDDHIEYVIGGDSSCDDSIEFCNGPLKSNTKYKMILRTFTKSGYRDNLAMEFRTDEPVKFYIILLSIVCVLLAAFLIGFIYMHLTRRKMWNRQSLNGIEDSLGDVSIKNYLVHYPKLSARDKVEREFKELAVVVPDVSVESIILRYNKSKNRYSDIYPYEKNRVILNSDSEGSDYINASFINGYRCRKEYIATQGPKPESFIDFWKMVTEYNVKVIVMVTQFVESNMIKCHQYFPLVNDKQMSFGNDVKIVCKSQTDNDIYDRRELTVKYGNDSVRTVTHFLFKTWPDHKVPSDPDDLITFIKRVKAEKIPSRSPIVVHCSAGVGRTGTLIALDMIMQKIKNESKVNIYETVKSLRFQRMKMVQSINQYQFLYHCTHELVKQKFEKMTKSKRNLFFRSNSSQLFAEYLENGGVGMANGGGKHMTNNNNSSISIGRTGIGDKKHKNNLSHSSIISNGRIKSNKQGFSLSSTNSVTSNEIESEM